jgi:hypothetical protein
MAFEQAQIPVQKTEEYEHLKLALQRVFDGGTVEKFLKKLEGGSIRIRQFEKVLERRVLEEVDPVLASAKKSARQLYEALAQSDQALMREFYLERIEEVPPTVREKFQKVYRYY